MTAPLPYMQEAWFSQLRQACDRLPQRQVAELLGVSGCALSLVLNGKGSYGNGRASTERFAGRVVNSLQALSEAEPAGPVRKGPKAHAYMREDWYRELHKTCQTMLHQAVALRLGVDRSAITHVLRGTGGYGTEIDPQSFAEKVRERLNRYECPFLTEQYSEVYRVTADDCRRYGHGPMRASSLMQGQHWMACQKCPQRPPAAHQAGAAKPPRRRKPRAPTPQVALPLCPTPTTTGETP